MGGGERKLLKMPLGSKISLDLGGRCSPTLLTGCQPENNPRIPVGLIQNQREEEETGTSQFRQGDEV